MDYSELWEIKYLSKNNGYYTIQNVENSLYLSMTPSIIKFEKDAYIENTWQHWTFIKISGNKYYIKNNGHNKYLSMDDNGLSITDKQDDVNSIWELNLTSNTTIINFIKKKNYQEIIYFFIIIFMKIIISGMKILY